MANKQFNMMILYVLNLFAKRTVAYSDSDSKMLFLFTWEFIDFLVYHLLKKPQLILNT